MPITNKTTPTKPIPRVALCELQFGVLRHSLNSLSNAKIAQHILTSTQQRVKCNGPVILRNRSAPGSRIQTKKEMYLRVRSQHPSLIE
jgi:hypothetical protein